MLRTLQLDVARCRRSSIYICILNTTGLTTVQDRLIFVVLLSIEYDAKSLTLYTTSQPAPKTCNLQRKRHHLRVDLVRPSTQGTSMLLRRMFKFLITLHCGSSFLCWFDRGVHSNSHGLTLCTCNLSESDAVMTPSSYWWIFSSGVPWVTSISEGPMDVFRYMKTLRSSLAIRTRLIRLLGFVAFGVKETTRQRLNWPL